MGFIKEKLPLTILNVLLVILVIFMSICLYLKYVNAKTALIKLEELNATSITFKQIDRNNEDHVFCYIKSNYKRVPSPTASLIAENVVKFAKELHVPISVIVGIIEVESGFDPCQVSSVRARGLMQVRWCVWVETLKEEGMNGEFDLHEIDCGILAGIAVLKYYIDKNNGDLSKALYDYVGKSENYISKVYKSMGRFILYEQRRETEKEINKS